MDDKDDQNTLLHKFARVFMSVSVKCKCAFSGNDSWHLPYLVRTLSILSTCFGNLAHPKICHALSIIICIAFVSLSSSLLLYTLLLPLVDPSTPLLIKFGLCSSKDASTGRAVSGLYQPGYSVYAGVDPSGVRICSH